MKYRYFFILLIFVAIYSCKNAIDAQEVTEKSDSLKRSSTHIISKIGETLSPKSKLKLSDWQEYTRVDEFMTKYYSISVSDALDNAQELSDLVGQMKDSVRIKNLEKSNVLARFNVLHSETLRLADMSNISSISDDEVKEEVLNILEVYSAVKSKINTIYSAEDIQNSLEVDTEVPFEESEVIQPRALTQDKGVL